MYTYQKLNNKTICIIRPDNYVPSGQLIVHFHGLLFRAEELKPYGVAEGYGFSEALTDIACDTCMVIPIGTWGRGTYSLPKDYSTVKGFNSLVDFIKEFTGESFSDISLSGHSAAYRVLTPLVQMQDLEFQRIFMFDLLYVNLVSPFTQWLLRNKTKYIYNVSRRGEGTDGNSDKITGHNYFNTRSKISDHWQLVNFYFREFLQKSKLEVKLNGNLPVVI